MAQLIAESHRLQLMQGLEGLLRGCGFGRIAGVDEAGRGCLAGPVVAAAVVVEPDRAVPGVDDSKSLRPDQRQRLAEMIRRVHRHSAVVATSPQEIDRINILEATRRSMSAALAQLAPAPDLALIDAVRLREPLSFPHLPVIRGDQISYAVACASILAKEARDRMMLELDARYPYYGFASNKGYGAPDHRRALQEYGPSEAHRLTFRSVLPRADLAPSRSRPRRARE